MSPGEGVHHLPQSVSCFSSIANTAPAFTSTSLTMQVRPIPNGVSARFRPPTDPQSLAGFRVRHGLGAGPLVAYLGTLQPRKNVELLAAAFVRARARVPDAELLLAGRIRPGYEPVLHRP